MISFLVSYRFLCQKKKKNDVLMNIHEYANELIRSFECKVKRQRLRFCLVPILSFFVEQRLRYG